MRRSERGWSRWFLAFVVASAASLVAEPGRTSPLDAGLERCVEHLPETDLEGQLLCLERLERAGPAAAAEVPALCALLDGSDGQTDHLLLAAVFDVFRALGPAAAPAAETLSSLLPYRSKLWQNRDKSLVVRLRAYLMVTLSEIGFPASAHPALFDALAHVDERQTAIEVGAAVRALGSLGPRGCELAPYLMDAFAERLSEEEFSLSRYDPRFPPEEATTVQLETVRAFGRVCVERGGPVRALFEQVAENRGTSGLDPRVVREARRVLGLPPLPAPERPFELALASAWAPAGQRSRLRHLDVAFKDQEGRPGVFAELIDKPALVTFFYTRCQNGKKCSLAVSRLGALQRRLIDDGIADEVLLLAITYEPQFDTPERLHRYATDRGLQLGDNARALQLDIARHQQVVDEFQAPVNTNAGWVNGHAVELSLLDTSGNLVRKYQTMLWDNDQVTEDLRRVIAER